MWNRTLCAPVLGNDSAAITKTVDFSSPEEISTGKTAHPREETLEIPQRVKPAQRQSARIPNHAPSHRDTLDHPVEEGPDK